MLSNLKKSKEEQPSKLRITDRVISYGGQTWAVRNITTISKYKITKENPYNFNRLAKATGVFLLSLFFASVSESIAGLVMMGSLAFIVYGIWQNIQNKPKYGLKIVSSAGESELLTSADEEFIDLLVFKITDVIQSDKPSNLMVNVDNRTIYDNVKNAVIGSTLNSEGDIGIGDKL